MLTLLINLIIAAIILTIIWYVLAMIPGIPDTVKKLGLDKAVLHRMTSSATSETKIVQPDSKQIDSWLKLGAYALFSDENDEASRRFCEVSECLSSASTLSSHPDLAQVPKSPLSV